MAQITRGTVVVDGTNRPRSPFWMWAALGIFVFAALTVVILSKSREPQSPTPVIVRQPIATETVREPAPRTIENTTVIERPGPVVTKTVTAPAAHDRTVVQGVPVPGPTVTQQVPVPGPTVTQQVPVPGPTVIQQVPGPERTVTAPSVAPSASPQSTP